MSSNSKLYVGNLSFKASEDDLNGLFSPFGDITDIFIVKDKFSKRSKGFAFVTMATEESAQSAIEKLNETEFLERNLVVNIASQKKTDQKILRRKLFSKIFLDSKGCSSKSIC